MKIALFTVYTTSYEVKAYARTARRLGYDLSLVPMNALLYKMEANGQINITVTNVAEDFKTKAQAAGVDINIVDPGTDVTDFDIILQRGTVVRGEPTLRRHSLLLKEFCRQNSIYLMNGALTEYSKGSKIWQHYRFAQQGIPVVPTRWVGSREVLEESFAQESFPVFVKEHVGKKGSNAYLIHSLEELKQVYAASDEPVDLLIQTYLPTREDIRVIVVGGKALGGMKRTAAEGAHVSNFSAGGSIDAVELTPTEQALAEKVATILKADYGGVDLMKDQKGNLYVLEFNMNAQFKGFEQATEIDVPEKVFAYLKQQKQ